MKLSTTFRVGVYTCEMTYDTDKHRRGEVTTTEVKWSPGMPKKAAILPFMDDYRRGRDAFYDEVGNAIGGKVLVVEI